MNYDIPEEFRNDDNRFPDSLVKFFLEQFTKERETVLDPFTGLGTTFFVAESLGRIPFGVELNVDRFNYVKSKVKHKENILLASALDIDKLGISNIDFCITSPPYMNIEEEFNALTNYSSKGHYNDYLNLLALIFKNVKKVLKKDAMIVLEVNNLKNTKLTTLAWDIGKKLSTIFDFQGEIIVDWQGVVGKKGIYGTGYDHSYCLVYKNKVK